MKAKMTILQYADALIEVQTKLNATVIQGININLPIQAIHSPRKSVHLFYGLRILAAELNIKPIVIPETNITNSKLEVEYKGFTFFELI